jgi:purine-binding chemotaxis protein CheW
MTVATAEKRAASTSDLQFATFYVGDLLLGVDIRQVQEINHQLDVTPVPRSPDYVRGVINLRGEVATVVDLRRVLGLDPAEATRESRNLIVHWQNESIGLWVDRIADILTVSAGEISPSPSNVDGVDGRFFHGVYTMESEIVVILNIEQVFADRDRRNP